MFLLSTTSIVLLVLENVIHFGTVETYVPTECAPLNESCTVIECCKPFKCKGLHFFWKCYRAIEIIETCKQLGQGCSDNYPCCGYLVCQANDRMIKCVNPVDKGGTAKSSRVLASWSLIVAVVVACAIIVYDS